MKRAVGIGMLLLPFGILFGLMVIDEPIILWVMLAVVAVICWISIAFELIRSNDKKP